MKYLSELLKVNSTLTQLNLSCTQENDSIIVKHSLHFVKYPSIDNHVGAEGVKYLSESLKINSTLTHLDLGGTQEMIVSLWYIKLTLC